MSEPLGPIRLSDYGAASVTPSPAGRMMAAVSADLRPGVDVNLGVGYVNEQTIPAAAIGEAAGAITAGDARYPLALNYGGPLGEPALLGAIRRWLPRRASGPVPAEVLDDRAILVGPSGATSVLDAFADVLPRGIVVTSDPYYYVYADVLQRRGFEIVAVPEDGDGARPDAIADAIDGLGGRRDAIRFLYIVTVNNPTGTVLPNERRRAFVDLAHRLAARLGRRVPLLLDRAYDDLVHDPAAPAPASMLPHDRDGLVYEVESLSKTVAPGLRIGFLVGPDGPFFRALVQRTSDVGFSGPPLGQAVAAHLLDHAIEDQINSVNAEYRRRATEIRAWIDAGLGDTLAGCRGGSAGFYYYLTLDGVETTEDSPFFRYCMRTTGDPAIDGPPGDPRPRVMYVPGEHCVHPDGQLTAVARRQLRLSYAYEPLARTEAAIAILGEAAAYARAQS